MCQIDRALTQALGIINDHEPALGLMRPGPRQERFIRVISRTCRARVQHHKMALSDIRQGQETLVKTPQTLIAGLLPAAAELHRGTYTVALGLTLMQQDRT